VKHKVTAVLFEEDSLNCLRHSVRIGAHRKSLPSKYPAAWSLCGDLFNGTDGSFNYEEPANDIVCSSFQAHSLVFNFERPFMRYE
jgi:hypothetical protein